MENCNDIFNSTISAIDKNENFSDILNTTISEIGKNEDLINETFLSSNELEEIVSKLNKFNIEIKFDEHLNEKLNDFIFNIFNEINKQNYKLITNSNNNIPIKKNVKNFLIKKLLPIIKIIIENKISPEINNDKILLIKNKEKSEEENKFNNNYYYIPINLIYKIIRCNNLLAINVRFKLRILISFRSGDAQIIFKKIYFYYKNINNELLKIDLNEKFKIEKNDLIFHIYNNILGIFGLCFCVCENSNCNYCVTKKQNKKNFFIFDNFIKYLNKLNNIYYHRDFTPIYYKPKPNSIYNNCNYKCSFCKTFKKYSDNKLWKYIFHNKNDPDHSCYFFICDDCYENNEKIINDVDIPCPNCKKFKTNFYQAEKLLINY